MTESQRLSFLIDRLAAGSQTRFARETGINQTTVNKIVREKAAVIGAGLGPSIRKRIIARFPQVSENWLRTGEGESGIAE